MCMLVEVLRQRLSRSDSLTDQISVALNIQSSELHQARDRGGNIAYSSNKTHQIGVTTAIKPIRL